MTVDLAAYFDEAVAAALQEWAEGKGGWVRLRSRLWSGGGHTGASLAAIILEQPRGASRKMIVKVLPAGEYAREPGQHEQAWSCSPDFANEHLVKQIDSRYPVRDGRFLMFQDIAGHSLLQMHTLGTVPADHQAAICGHVSWLLLNKWNGGQRRHKRTTVAEYLRMELRDALQEGRSAHQWASTNGLLKSGIDWITTLEDQDRSMPNPVGMAELVESFGGIQIDYLFGYTHGDLHWDNVLVPLSERLAQQPDFDEIRLIDLCTFDDDAPLTRDLVALILSTVAKTAKRELTGSGADALLDFVINPNL